jgi:hypothetical protein
MKKKYFYHYSCRFEKCVDGRKFEAAFSGTYTAFIKIDNERIYAVFKDNIWNDIKDNLFQCFTKNEMQIISLTFLHEVDE